jgi:hypothetical protein
VVVALLEFKRKTLCVLEHVKVRCEVCRLTVANIFLAIIATPFTFTTSFEEDGKRCWYRFLTGLLVYGKFWSWLKSPACPKLTGKCTSSDLLFILHFYKLNTSS